MTRTFTCGLCGGAFDSDPSFTEAERLAEMQLHFGDLPPEERASVCDDCFKKIDPANHPHLVEEASFMTQRRGLIQSDSTVPFAAIGQAFVPELTGQIVSMTREEAMRFFGESN